MDLKSEIKSFLFGRTDVTKVNITAEYNSMADEQKYIFKKMSEQDVDVYALKSLYNPAEGNYVIAKVNFDAEFPVKSVSEELYQTKLNSLITKLQAMSWGFSSVNYSVSMSLGSIWDKIFINARQQSMSESDYQKSLAQLNTIMESNYTFPSAKSTFQTSPTTDYRMFSDEALNVIQRDVINKVAGYLEEIIRLGVAPYFNTDAERIRSKAIANAQKYPAYLVVDGSLADYQVLEKFASLNDNIFTTTVFTDYLTATLYKLNFNFNEYPVNKLVVDKKLHTVQISSSTSRSGYKPYNSGYVYGPKDVLFSTYLTHYKASDITYLVSLLEKPAQLSKIVKTEYAKIASTFNYNFFNQLIFIRDFYSRYQSTAYLFASQGDKESLAMITSGNFLSLLQTQKKLLVPNGLGPLMDAGLFQNSKEMQFEGLLRFLRITTMGYLKEGQIITTDLQPYFTVNDDVKSVVNRILAVSPMVNTAYAIPVWVTNIIGSAVNIYTVPNGQMVIKVINDCLSEADETLKWFTIR